MLVPGVRKIDDPRPLHAVEQIIEPVGVVVCDHDRRDDDGDGHGQTGSERISGGSWDMHGRPPLLLVNRGANEPREKAGSDRPPETVLLWRLDTRASRANPRAHRYPILGRGAGVVNA